MSSPEIVHIPVAIHGRVVVEPCADPTAWLLGFHGYGESAEDHLERLRAIRGDRPWWLASAQALHPFYRRRDGGVVASWMTKLDRDLTIAENVRYVTSAVGNLRDSHRLREVPLVLVGFSQGVAMAFRAAAALGDQVAALVVSGGDVPPELRESGPSLAPTLLTRGASDEAYPTTRWAEDTAVLERRARAVEVFEHESGHDWPASLAAASASFLERHTGGSG